MLHFEVFLFPKNVNLFLKQNYKSVSCLLLKIQHTEHVEEKVEVSSLLLSLVFS